MSWPCEVCHNLRTAGREAMPCLAFGVVFFFYLGLAEWSEEPAADDPPSCAVARLLALIAFFVLTKRQLALFFKNVTDAIGQFFHLLCIIIICNTAMSVVWDLLERMVYYSFVNPMNARIHEAFGVELGEENMQNTIMLSMAIMLLYWILFSDSTISAKIRYFRRILCLEPHPVRTSSQVEVRMIVPQSHNTRPAPPEHIRAPGGHGRNPIVQPHGGPPAIGQ